MHYSSVVHMLDSKSDLFEYKTDVRFLETGLHYDPHEIAAGDVFHDKVESLFILFCIDEAADIRVSETPYDIDFIS